jgi:hypothetical protein
MQIEICEIYLINQKDFKNEFNGPHLLLQVKNMKALPRPG